MINAAEFFFVNEFGITKIRVTGGEPLVRHDVAEIIGDMAKLPVKLGLTTNALSLHLHLDRLIDAGLKSINISLDTFDADRFQRISRRNGHDQVMRNIQLALQKGLRVKLNMVVMRGVNDDEILQYVQLSHDHEIHVRFIEFMPFAGNKWGKEKVLTYSEMLDRISGEHTIEKLDDDPNSTAKAYRVIGWPGTFAVISTITEPFCGSCDRLRLTADGKLRNCLFSREESDLLAALRKGLDVRELIQRNVLQKYGMLGGLEFGAIGEISERPMVAIGG